MYVPTYKIILLQDRLTTNFVKFNLLNWCGKKSRLNAYVLGTPSLQSEFIVWNIFKIIRQNI